MRLSSDQETAETVLVRVLRRERSRVEATPRDARSAHGGGTPPPLRRLHPRQGVIKARRLSLALYLAGASADDLLEAEALRRESLTGSEAALDASHEEYVRREELVAAAREVGWEPFSCEEIRAVTLER